MSNKDKNDEAYVDNLLDFDPLRTAEKITGKSYKEEEGMGPTNALGFLLMRENSDAKKRALAENNDTYWSCPVTQMLLVADDLGFETVVHEEFEHITWDSREKEWKKQEEDNDHYYIMWHPEKGILLTFDTYGRDSNYVDGKFTRTGKGPTINGSTFYYNWAPYALTQDLPKDDPLQDHWSATATRSAWDEKLQAFSGNHDAREGMRHKISKLDRFGEFINPWKLPCIFYLTHWGDQKRWHMDNNIEYSCSNSPWYKDESGSRYNSPFNQKTKERYEQLPEEIRTRLVLWDDFYGK